MKLLNPYRCDRKGCSTTKGDANHWWLIYSPDGASHFEVRPWNVEHQDDTGVLHACSEACVSKMLSSWVAEMHRRPVAAPVEEAVSE